MDANDGKIKKIHTIIFLDLYIILKIIKIINLSNKI